MKTDKKTERINKKAQMKIQQMSFLLIAVFMFFSLVGMIVVTMMLSNIRNSVADLKEQDARLLASRIANSPEFSCGEVYGDQKTDCIDLDKVMVLIDNSDKYETFWGVDNIEIRRTYPLLIIGGNVVGERLCTKDSYPRCNYFKIMDKPLLGVDKSNFVALCRKEKYMGEIVNKCEMGKIIIRYGEDE
jgi:hypothetical protein